ncbi:MAG: hypothetical protein Barrevirus2_29 [Barrevirus sp.]|uniref:Uncharacterized protein n=1 Tax=Barrevirus sp. TaxID=2487763 RepID=A0A3G4ZPQ7_9VIRU|nr:MAG: hypothetical protein Barrevirus2_29 [Barrevirus sp.]
MNSPNRQFNNGNNGPRIRQNQGSTSGPGQQFYQGRSHQSDQEPRSNRNDYPDQQITNDRPPPPLHRGSFNGGFNGGHGRGNNNNNGGGGGRGNNNAGRGNGGRGRGNNNYNNNGYRKNNYNNYQQNDKETDNDNIQGKIKEELINYIYNTITLSNYKYKLIEFDYDLPLLKEKNHLVSPNYNGVHSLLVFIKIQDKFMSVIIDRKTLTYRLDQINYNSVKTITVSIRLDQEVYNGTIIDGVLLYNNNDTNKTFVVNDIYYLRGKDVSADKIQNKMRNFSTYLETVGNPDTDLENLTLIPNKVFELKDIEQLINTYIPKSKNCRAIKGLTFYPEYSGTKLIYLYNNSAQDQNKEVPQSNSVVSQQDDKKVVLEQVVKESIVDAVFKMKKTDIVDVYTLFLGERYQEDGKTMFKYIKVGIAYIPTKECSFFCKEAFTKGETDAILIKCKYDRQKGRWIPNELAKDRKRSDLIQDVMK